jgi:hypothetical protein
MPNYTTKIRGINNKKKLLIILKEEIIISKLRVNGFIQVGKSVYRGEDLINALLAEGKIDLLNNKIRVGFLEVEPINNRETYTVNARNSFSQSDEDKKTIDEEQFPWEEELDNLFVQEEAIVNQGMRLHRTEGIHFENAFFGEKMIEGNPIWEREENKRIVTCPRCYSEVDPNWKFCPCCGKTGEEEEMNEEIKQ